jgi:tetratricopeptide (TPR) repeat protein
MSTDRQQQVVEAVEASLRDVSAPFLDGPLFDAAVQIWQDFADETDVSRTQKPETWAAALLYVIDQMQWGNNVSQDDVADWFGVSAITVSQKYRTIAETLELRAADARYLSDELRRRIERDLGALPDMSLTEAVQTSHFWHRPFDLRDDPYRDAQEWVYNGWEVLSNGEVDLAAECFEEALALDDMLADAYNGLAGVALERDDLDAAASHYRRAYDLARATLGSEAPNAFHWWADIDTRPYMRAREGRAYVSWQMGNYREAASEYEALLRLNSNDNQGARFNVGPLYQLAGDLDAALDAYDSYADKYPDDWGDPHHRFSWGLALYRDDQPKAALRRWRQAIFQNVYVAPLLLDEPLPETDVWHGINTAYPYYAEDYVDEFGPLWDEAARDALAALWQAPPLREVLDEWLDAGRRLHALAPDVRQGDEDAYREWRDLMTRREELRTRSLTNETLRDLRQQMP